MFRRDCDMMCDVVSEWFESLSAAQEFCVSSLECVSVVDHSANKGKFGVCAKDAKFTRGSEKHETYRAVCVERKRTLAGDSVNLLQLAVSEAPALSAKGGSEMFQRQCDMMCNKVSDWFESLVAAQQSCASRVDCNGVVDHSANKGKVGLCTKGSTFSRGSDKSPTYAAVCVEHRLPQDTQQSLLQTSVAEAPARTSSVSSMFRRDCDVMCDAVSEWFESLSAAQEFCVSSLGCVGVVDHSANKGKFGVCATDARFTRGSEKYETYRAVCVERRA
jgi:hypothetical protein